MRESTVKEYANPLIQRYASQQMSYLFSPEYKFTTWRKLWIALAEVQQELGLPISDEQIQEMRQNFQTLDYDLAEKFEAETRHDVMAHIQTFGILCPNAKPIIHLGATSAFVGDNTDLIQMRNGCILLVQRLTTLLETLGAFALRYKEVATLGYTHFQPAQCTTVGKRATLWLLDMAMDVEALLRIIETLPFRGVKGTTGTQASFMHLFNNDHEKVKALDLKVSKKMGFDKTVPVTGQTYTRKIDADISYVLCGMAQTFHKFANDLRLLQHLREIEEPFEKSQVGSSAMAYKRNPMRSERLTSLCRFIFSLSTSPIMTAAEQWFERTLDDSANKRLSIPELFLAADASCIIALNIAKGLVVYPKIIENHLNQELPFMATEHILMASVQKGNDRQIVHEAIRKHSMEAYKQIKEYGKTNDLLERIINDQTIGLSNQEVTSILNAEHFTGRAKEQTVEFIQEYLQPIITKGKKFGTVYTSDIVV